MHRCAFYTHKKWKGCTVFANVCPSNEGKKFQLVRRLGVAGPTQKSLWSSLHLLWPAILSQSKACLLKRIYSIYLILKRGNLKVIQFWGMIPKGRNTNFVLDGPKKKKYKVCLHMAVNLNNYKVLCMKQIIFSAQVWHNISLVITTSYPWISSNREDLMRLLCIMFKRRQAQHWRLK